MTQVDKLKQYLDLKGSVTIYESFIELGITSLSSVVSQLNKTGYEVEGDMVKVLNRDGKEVRVKRYRKGRNLLGVAYDNYINGGC